MSGTPLHPIWHLRQLDRADDEWLFTTNYKLGLENSTLRNRLQGETPKPVHISATEAGVHVEVLVRELRDRTGGMRSISEGELTLDLLPRLEHVIRKSTQENWLGRIGCDGYLRDSKNRPVQQFADPIELASLSAPSRKAIHLLDLMSLRLCHEIYAEKLKDLDGYPVEDLPPIRRVSVFVAYRRTHAEGAQSLYDVLERMGGGLYFEPYIDRHQVESGEWKSQLMDRIERTDMFMPLVSPDYAAEETVGREEYEWAAQVAEERGISDFFVPVFLGQPETDTGSALLDFDGFEIDLEDDIHSENDDLEAWLGRVLVAGLGRPDRYGGSA